MSDGGFCSVHGTFNKGTFCPNCGMELTKKPEEENSNRPFQMMGKKPCPACGFKLNHGHQQFCPGCGHVLQWLCR